MTKELKVGDRLRLSTGVEAEVTSVWLNNFECCVSDRVPYTGKDLLRIGITWELIEPELVEPPVGSAIRFTVVGLPSDSRSIAWNESGDWLSTRGLYEWSSLVEEYGITDYELLRPEKEVVREVISKPYMDSATTNRLAKEYGVEL